MTRKVVGTAHVHHATDEVEPQKRARVAARPSHFRDACRHLGKLAGLALQLHFLFETFEKCASRFGLVSAAPGSDDAQSSSVVSIEAPAIHDLPNHGSP